MLQCRAWCINRINSIVDMLANSQFDLALLVSKELYYWLFMSIRMTFGQWGNVCESKRLHKLQHKSLFCPKKCEL